MTREEAMNRLINQLGYGAKGAELVIDQIFNDHEAIIKAKDEEIERFFGLIKSLWQIIDDIDTHGDMAKSDDALFRRLVENKQKERWKLPISTDGYEIFLKDNQ